MSEITANNFVRIVTEIRQEIEMISQCANELDDRLERATCRGKSRITLPEIDAFLAAGPLHNEKDFSRVLLAIMKFYGEDAGGISPRLLEKVLPEGHSMMESPFIDLATMIEVHGTSVVSTLAESSGLHVVNLAIEKARKPYSDQQGLGHEQ